MDPKFFLFLLSLSLVGVLWKSGPVLAVWMHARSSGAAVSFFKLWRMFFRNVPLRPVMDAHVAAVEAGVEVDLDELVAHALAGGDTRAVVIAYVETLRAGTEIDFSRVCELELSEPEGEEAFVSSR